MSVNQPSLSKYIKTLMSDVYNSQPVSVHHFLDRTKSQQAYNAGVEQVISSLDFRIVSNQQIIVKYLSSPQVDDVLLSYLVLLLANNYCGHQLTSKLPKRESVINHLLKTAEQNFSELQDDNSIEFLRKLYHELFDACEKSYGADVYSDNISIGNIPHSVAEHTARDKHFNTLILRVNAAFNEEYIAFDAAFEATKAEYMKVLRSAYQTGFIYLLGEHKFSEFYVPPVICNSDESPLLQHYLYQHTDKISTQRNSWKYIFSNSNIIYVIGGAGYGKSLFLKNIVNNYAQLSFRNSSQYLVIYCDIKTFYTNGDNGKKTIADFLQESMINLTGAENISKDMILYYMKRGRCIILFDALDEVPKEMRLNLHKKLVTYFSGQNQSNKVCITSRARGFIPQSNIDVKEILPLFEKDIEEYIDKMICLKKFNKTEKSRFLRQAKVLNDKDFLNSFLILSLLVNIYKSEKALPENKIELYKKCFEYIAKNAKLRTLKQASTGT